MAHRVGIIGLGTVGSRFVEQFNLHNAFDLVAAWDLDPNACSPHKDSVKIASTAGEVIAESDLVYVAVPPIHHETYVRDCLANNTAIFCENTLGVDILHSRQLEAEETLSAHPA